MNWREATNEQALEAWDNNELIWSCSMGGLGPGYEQCIQLMGFEMLRAMLADMPDSWEKLTPEDRDSAEVKDEKRKRWEAFKDKIENVPAVKALIKQLRPSGAQFGAAINIASVFARNGYSRGMELVPEDRRIQVQKKFPQVA